MKPHLLSLVIAAGLFFVPGDGAARADTATAPAISVTGKAQPGLESFDSMMTQFLQEHHVPGAALAVTRLGRLVYARGFGLADREAREPVEPGSLFRIASVSKPITSAAIMKLVEAGKLQLDAAAFKLLNVPTIIQGNFKADQRINQISILELLQHRGGFDRDASLDPMFQSVNFARIAGSLPPALPEDIIRVMEGRPLDFAPGERYAYSNFGYCVLGRVIEHVTGQTYGEAVRQLVFRPLGIEHIQLGRTLAEQRAKGEVKYYTVKDAKGGSVFASVGQGKQVPLPYGAWCIEAMDSHGGWIAGAPELVKFASAFDDRTHGLLEAKSLETVFARPPGAAGLQDNKLGGKPADVWYGCGWQVRDAGQGRINTWHTGLLDGTESILVRRWDGLDWAVLFNQNSDEQGKSLAGEIDPLVHQAADQVKQWPEGIDRKQAWP